MQLFFFSLTAMLLAFLGMAIGVILANKELKGSCGGISNIPGMKSDCSCSNPCEKRKAEMKKEQSADSIDKIADEEKGQFENYSKINLDQLRTTIK